MLSANMLGHRGPRFLKEAVNGSPQGIDVHAMSAFSIIALDDSQGHCPLGYLPVSFGTFAAPANEPGIPSSPIYGSYPIAAAAQITRFEWGVYGFSNGHFV